MIDTEHNGSFENNNRETDIEIYHFLEIENSATVLNYEHWPIKFFGA